MLHALITPPQYFGEVLNGLTADLKKDDRPYQKGDTVLLQEFDGSTQKFTGRELELTLTNVKRNAPKDGLRNGFALLHWTKGELKTHVLPEGYGLAANGETKDTATSDTPTIEDQNPL